VKTVCSSRFAVRSSPLDPPSCIRVKVALKTIASRFAKSQGNGEQRTVNREL